MSSEDDDKEGKPNNTGGSSMELVAAPVVQGVLHTLKFVYPKFVYPKVVNSFFACLKQSPGREVSGQEPQTYGTH